MPAGAATLCPSCELNRIIPDLTALGNRAAWHKIEIAKRRNLDTLARPGLTPLNKKQDAVKGLAFDFLRPTGSAQVLTGHEDGLITLNVEEAEDTEREKPKALLGEMYRTLVGHFRHEIAHFYWDRFFQGRSVDDPILLAPALNEVVASLGHPTFYPFVFSESIIRKFSFVHHMVRFYGNNPADAVQPPVNAAPERSALSFPSRERHPRSPRCCGRHRRRPRRAPGSRH